MLVISRRLEQEFCLPDIGVTVKILRVKGSTVRLGIVAPSDTRVLRKELLTQRESLGDSPQLPESQREHELNARLDHLRRAVNELRDQILGSENNEAQKTIEWIDHHLNQLRVYRQSNEFLTSLTNPELPAA